MKVAIISHKTSNLINSRGKLIEAFLNKGYNVVAIGNEDINIKKIKKLGIKFRPAPFDRTSINFLENYKYYKKVKKILKEENVDIVLSYTIKPIIFGSIAARANKIKNIYSLITGMGYNYSVNTLRTKFVRIFSNIGYKVALKFNKKVIFQNKEDMEELIAKKYIKKEQAELVDGSGVDLKVFKRKENIINKKFTFLMVSRMLNVKGVIEYCKAADYIKKIYPNTRFIHCGEKDKSYRGIDKKFISYYEENNIVEFKGRVKNMVNYLTESNVVVLPSYLREGIPRTLLEALAVGRPIITTNIRGCKEAVENGKNGYLVQPRSVEELIKAMEKMINNTAKELAYFSENSYKKAVNRFNVNIINKKMIEIIEKSIYNNV